MVCGKLKKKGEDILKAPCIDYRKWIWPELYFLPLTMYFYCSLWSLDQLSFLSQYPLAMSDMSIGKYVLWVK